MLRQVLFAKIHRAVVTDSNPDYMGSVTISQAPADGLDEPVVEVAGCC